MDKARTILIYYFLTIILISTYVPWKIERYNQFRVFKGYSFVLSPPSRTHSIDFSVIGIEILIATSIFFIIYLVKSKNNKTDSEQTSANYAHAAKRSFEFTPTMPDLTSGIEIQTFKNKDYLFIFKKSVVSIGEAQTKNALPIKYPLIMFAIKIKNQEPILPSLIVCQEYGFTEKTYLCFFNEEGLHVNLGEINYGSPMDEFIQTAFDLTKEHLQINLNEVKAVK